MLRASAGLVRLSPGPNESPRTAGKLSGAWLGKSRFPLPIDRMASHARAQASHPRSFTQKRRVKPRVSNKRTMRVLMQSFRDCTISTRLVVEAMFSAAKVEFHQPFTVAHDQLLEWSGVSRTTLKRVLRQIENSGRIERLYVPQPCDRTDRRVSTYRFRLSGEHTLKLATPAALPVTEQAPSPEHLNRVQNGPLCDPPSRPADRSGEGGGETLGVVEAVDSPHQCAAATPKGRAALRAEAVYRAKAALGAKRPTTLPDDREGTPERGTLSPEPPGDTRPTEALGRLPQDAPKSATLRETLRENARQWRQEARAEAMRQEAERNRNFRAGGVKRSQDDAQRREFLRLQVELVSRSENSGPGEKS